MNYKLRSPIAVIVFSILTCGFYFFYWIYAISAELRYYSETDSITPGLELLLCIVCFPYLYYWFYKYSKLIYIAQSESTVAYPEDNSLLNVLLSIFGLGIIGAAIMQSSANKIWRQYEDKESK